MRRNGRASIVWARAEASATPIPPRTRSAPTVIPADIGRLTPSRGRGRERSRSRRCALSCRPTHPRMRARNVVIRAGDRPVRESGHGRPRAASNRAGRATTARGRCRRRQVRTRAPVPAATARGVRTASGGVSGSAFASGVENFARSACVAANSSPNLRNRFSGRGTELEYGRSTMRDPRSASRRSRLTFVLSRSIVHLAVELRKPATNSSVAALLPNTARRSSCCTFRPAAER